MGGATNSILSFLCLVFLAKETINQQVNLSY